MGNEHGQNMQLVVIEGRSGTPSPQTLNPAIGGWSVSLSIILVTGVMLPNPLASALEVILVNGNVTQNKL